MQASLDAHMHVSRKEYRATIEHLYRAATEALEEIGYSEPTIKVTFKNKNVEEGTTQEGKHWTKLIIETENGAWFSLMNPSKEERERVERMMPGSTVELPVEAEEKLLKNFVTERAAAARIIQIFESAKHIRDSSPDGIQDAIEYLKDPENYKLPERPTQPVDQKLTTQPADQHSTTQPTDQQPTTQPTDQQPTAQSVDQYTTLQNTLHATVAAIKAQVPLSQTAMLVGKQELLEWLDKHLSNVEEAAKKVKNVDDSANVKALNLASIALSLSANIAMQNLPDHASQLEVKRRLEDCEKIYDGLQMDGKILSKTHIMVNSDLAGLIVIYSDSRLEFDESAVMNRLREAIKNIKDGKDKSGNENAPELVSTLYNWKEMKADDEAVKFFLDDISDMLKLIKKFRAITYNDEIAATITKMPEVPPGAGVGFG
jgi:hypothetical protein